MEKHQSKNNVTSTKVYYTVTDIPPFMVSFLLAFQNYFTICISNLTIPILLAPGLCLFEDNVGKSELTGTLFVASGIITLIQSIFGIRLPIVQAGTYAVLVPTLSYLSLTQNQCPLIVPQNNNTGPGVITGSAEHREIWMNKLREIQGCIMIAALFEVIAGMTGIIGWMMKFIGPLTICPTVTLIGLSLFKSATTMASKHWPISIFVLFLMILFSQFLGQFQIPCLLCSKRKRFYTQKFKVFKMLPIVFSISIAWLLCYILTITDYFPSSSTEYGYYSRTDLRKESIKAAPWFRFPYPGQWGVPTFTLAGVFAILSGILATTIESVGDYYSCAKLSGAPPPPAHAINRGIFVEGIGSLLDGIFGTGNGTTSSTINIGVIGITKVGSKIVIQISACIMILFGLFTKAGAIFLSIPDSVTGGVFFILFGMIVAIGLSNLQYVDLNSGRNLFVLGTSLLIGMAIPEWISNNEGVIQTGSPTADNVLFVLLKTHMTVGGVLGFLLDNTIPGSRKLRGMHHWDELREASHSLDDSPSNSHENLKKRLSDIYDLPYISKYLAKFRIFSMIPLCPSYKRFSCKIGRCDNIFSNKFCLCLENYCNRNEEDEETFLEKIRLDPVNSNDLLITNLSISFLIDTLNRTVTERLLDSSLFIQRLSAFEALRPLCKRNRLAKIFNIDFHTELLQFLYCNFFF